MYSQYEIKLTHLITGRARNITLFASDVLDAMEKVSLLVPEIQVAAPTHSVQVAEIKVPKT